MFAHEKLQAYGKALNFAAKVTTWTGTWDKKHALVDQLSRASDSIVLNLAEAARQRGTPARLRIADYAIGSSLECAGCLDVARIKELLTRQDCHREKHLLCEITKMLIGLRKAWSQSVVREEPVAYATKPLKAKVGDKVRGDIPESLFHHERLEVYQEALGFMEWFVIQPGAKDLSNRLFRQMDEAGTSVVLNIAEGNGRYAELDHHRFLQIAQSAAVKGAVYLDLAVERALLVNAEATTGKEMLQRISAMLAGF
jgi:four helix bundle protein